MSIKEDEDTDAQTDYDARMPRYSNVSIGGFHLDDDCSAVATKQSVVLPSSVATHAPSGPNSGSYHESSNQRISDDVAGADSIKGFLTVLSAIKSSGNRGLY